MNPPPMPTSPAAPQESGHGKGGGRPRLRHVQDRSGGVRARRGHCDQPRLSRVGSVGARRRDRRGACARDARHVASARPPYGRGCLPDGRLRRRDRRAGGRDRTEYRSVEQTRFALEGAGVKTQRVDLQVRVCRHHGSRARTGEQRSCLRVPAALRCRLRCHDWPNMGRPGPARGC